MHMSLYGEVRVGSIKGRRYKGGGIKEGGGINGLYCIFMNE